MKLCTLALDFDGTIAEHDRLDPEVRKAIAELRALGIVVLIVTGRILADLERVVGDLTLVDAVVAENGAVLAFPGSGYSRLLGRPPSAALIEALEHERIAFSAGRSVVEADADDAPRILAILRRLELPLTIAFNRSRLMLLPQAVSKSSGLLQALRVLRLSPRNAVAIGDAENDHELLDACELGVAVAWGSRALQKMADVVLPGHGPPAVATYVRDLARQGRIPQVRVTRRRVLLGDTASGRPFSLSVRGRNEIVAGDPKSGKSWITGLLCEQLILHGYALCILDPEGDYGSLEALPGVTRFGRADPLPRPMDLLRALRHADLSAVIDLSHATPQERGEYLRATLPALATLRRSTGLPHRIVIDEAHYVLHDREAHGLLDLEGGGYTLVSYRASQLHPDLLAAAQVALVTRESDPAEVHALRALCRACSGRFSEPQWQKLFQDLRIGEAVALPITDEADREIQRIQLTPRLTPHVRHLTKYVDIPVPESRAFVFGWRDERGPRRAGTLLELVQCLADTPLDELRGYLRRHDVSRWIEDVFGDYPLARTVREIEAKGELSTSNAAHALVEAVRSRYALATPEQVWSDPRPGR